MSVKTIKVIDIPTTQENHVIRVTANFYDSRKEYRLAWMMWN